MFQSFNPMCAGEATDGRVIRSYFRMNDFVLLLSSRSREREDDSELDYVSAASSPFIMTRRSGWGFFFHPFGLVFWVFCLFPFLLLNDCPAKFGASFKLDWTIRLEGIERRELRSIGYKALPSNYHLIRQQCCSTCECVWERFSLIPLSSISHSVDLYYPSSDSRFGSAGVRYEIGSPAEASVASPHGKNRQIFFIFQHQIFFKRIIRNFTTYRQNNIRWRHESIVRFRL